MSTYQLNDWQFCNWQTPTRWYCAELIQDLWGDWQIRQSWGSRTSARGNRQSRSITSPDEGLRILKDIAKRRQQRGYIEVG